MALVVQKYGGTSVADLDRIRAVAERVAARRAAGDSLVVVVSAMAGETNRLLALAKAASPAPSVSETDVLVTTGEQVSAALLAIVLTEQGVPARSFLGHQIPIRTNRAHGRASIDEIGGDRLRAVLGDGYVAVAAGFQGATETGEITTLGRGGSDTSAVALAAALEADVCEIYTDVDGVYTADPRIVADARKLDRIAHDEMLELAGLGTKVLHIRSVAFAKRYGVPLHVRSSFNDEPGTWVVKEDSSMEQVSVSGVTYDQNQAKLTLEGVPDRPGIAAKVFGPIADAGIVVDMIIQNASADGTTDLTFTVPESDYEKARELLDEVNDEIGAAAITGDVTVAKVSIVGLGMRTHAGIAAHMFDVLASEGINVEMISTSEIKVSVVIESKYAELAVRALHKALVEADA